MQKHILATYTVYVYVSSKTKNHEHEDSSHSLAYMLEHLYDGCQSTDIDEGSTDYPTKYATPSEATESVSVIEFMSYANTLYVCRCLAFHKSSRRT